MSERLKEIKTDVESMYNALNRDDIDGFLDVVENFIDNGYFEWLIAQAERVQELEREVEDREKFELGTTDNLKILREQNKRYREAINNINEKTSLLGVNEQVYEAIQDATEALEESE